MNLFVSRIRTTTIRDLSICEPSVMLMQYGIEQSPVLICVKDIGPGIHYLQEDNPEGIGNSILEWISKIT
jgi:hypothetical protein